MTSRPVWLTREQRDAIHRGRFADATAARNPAMDDAMAAVVVAWDAAPADPFRAARRALSHPDWDNDPLEVNVHVLAVLSALGCPDPERPA